MWMQLFLPNMDMLNEKAKISFCNDSPTKWPRLAQLCGVSAYCASVCLSVCL